jgi:hypothetical protein
MNAVEAGALPAGDLVLEQGVFTFPPECVPSGATSCFVPTLLSPNAVRATAQTTVNNILAGIFLSPTTTITKVAIGAVGPPRSVGPGAPWVLGDCCFPDDCEDQSCLPGGTIPSTSDNQGWTGFFGTASDNSILSYFPDPCGGGAAIPVVNVGDSINITNGDSSPLFRAVRCMVCDPAVNQREFIVPVVACAGSCGSTQFNQSMEVTGFATVTIDGFLFQGRNAQWQLGSAACTGYTGANGGQAPVQIRYSSIMRTTPVGGGIDPNGGCTGCPVKNVAMVQ